MKEIRKCVIIFYSSALVLTVPIMFCVKGRYLCVRDVYKNKRLVIVSLSVNYAQSIQPLIETGVFRRRLLRLLNTQTHTCSVTNDRWWFFSFTAFANAIDPHLEILPSGDMQTKPIGSSILLTCKPKVDNPELVQDMQWLDPQNRVIESLK